MRKAVVKQKVLHNNNTVYLFHYIIMFVINGSTCLCLCHFLDNFIGELLHVIIIIMIITITCRQHVILKVLVMLALSSCCTMHCELLVLQQHQCWIVFSALASHHLDDGFEGWENWIYLVSWCVFVEVLLQCIDDFSSCVGRLAAWLPCLCKKSGMCCLLMWVHDRLE